VTGALPLKAADQPTNRALVWQSTSKSYQAKRGETNAYFSFPFANGSSNEIVVHSLRASCDCTAPKMPFRLPGKLLPGEAGQMEVNVDLRDRSEPFKQTISIETSAGTDQVTMDIKTPELTARERDQRAAFADRQAVFKGDCVRCHLRPALGKPIGEQCKVLCGTCHDSTRRDKTVPELAVSEKTADKAYWEQWVRRGKPGTFMPAFSKQFGGPLTEDQIESLIAYLASAKR
jgi:mono/diheme cytochrome c family protein